MLLCQVEAQLQCNQEWTVKSTADASNLSAALTACEGDTFSVVWTGHVVVEDEIKVPDGKSLSISGKELGASADGTGSTPLFSVEDATLNIENMVVINGFRNVTGGGAILASGGEVHISGLTVFMGNEYSSGTDEGGGGAVHVVGSTLTWTGNTTFFNNTALDWDGGALFCAWSICSGDGTSSFKNNVANQDAGAVRIHRSIFSCDGTTSFVDNATPSEGGAVFATDDSAASFSGITHAAGNSAANGGAFSLRGDSGIRTNLTFSGRTSIVNNTAQGDGGGMAVAQGCAVAWDGSMTFANNVAGDDGGGLAIDGDSQLTIGGDALFARNSAGNKGGAVYANANIEGLMYAGAVFEFNSAAIGGAIASFSTEESAPSYYTGCTFRHNSATFTGGAIEVSVGEEEISNSTFVDNLAGTENSPVNEWRL